MRCLTDEALDQLLARAGIRVADPGKRVGRELSYHAGPRRIVVVHLNPGYERERVVEALTRILSLKEEWILMPRYGTAEDLEVSQSVPGVAAVAFGPLERLHLAQYLCERSMDLETATADLYLLAGDGRILVTWNHHTAEDGLEIALQSVSETSQLLAALNEWGAELNVFANDGQQVLPADRQRRASPPAAVG